MKYSLATAAILATVIDSVFSAQNIGGNWYGKAVERITYTNWGAGGTYQKVSDMSNGRCKFEEVTYSGGTSPLDGEVSWHFRGPMHLKQFAFYTPGTSSKRSIKPSTAQKRHGHNHQERRGADMITATINGNVVSWANPNAHIAAPTWAPVAHEPAYEPKAATPTVNAGAGNWGRQAYYNAQNGTADGLVFLNNMGGQGSGVFDHVWGNSLSYAASNSKSGSSSPQVLDNVLLEDNAEVILYSDKACSGDDCGAYRPKTVAYHGFSGETKLFLVELDMPMSGKTGFNMDMPAAWMLNAAIPRTAQYSDCSCWKTGCGEWDIFEILDSGNTRAKSTIHAGKNSGGESDYFQRPVDKTIKAAIVFDGVQQMGDIIILPDETLFDTMLSDDLVAGFSKRPLLENLSKIFKVGSFMS